jgi:hypothetical protein
MARGLKKKSFLLLLAFGLFVQLHASCGPMNGVKGASHDQSGARCLRKDLEFL